MTKRLHAPLGQVFLTDRRVADRILQVENLQPSDAVMEIGAGPGNMTARLASTGARVWAVEIDPALAQGLHEKFADNPRVEVLESDILQVSIEDLVCSARRQRIKVFGNLPYYITSPCLLHLFHHHRWLEEIVVMVQQEVALRIIAVPGSADYGLFSVTCQYYTRPALLFTIPPSAFRPAPQVHSALVRMEIAPQKEALGIQDEETFWRWMKAAFAQKRKTLVNNWKQLCQPERLRRAMEQFGIDRRARAEALSLVQLAALQKALVGPGDGFTRARIAHKMAEDS
ncbi:MAG: ribosomal RNA small subunit methyltransferase A [Acidobacteria bacterium]|nr:ribosomal RNA small subunit methyltransferase A [Acidobacteriota bacterium]